MVGGFRDFSNVDLMARPDVKPGLVTAEHLVYSHTG